jgi:hypothetical protein
MIAVAVLVALFWCAVALLFHASWWLVAVIGVGTFAVSWLAMALCAVGAGRMEK